MREDYCPLCCKAKLKDPSVRHSSKKNRVYSQNTIGSVLRSHLVKIYPLDPSLTDQIVTPGERANRRVLRPQKSCSMSEICGLSKMLHLQCSPAGLVSPKKGYPSMCANTLGPPVQELAVLLDCLLLSFLKTKVQVSLTLDSRNDPQMVHYIVAILHWVSKEPLEWCSVILEFFPAMSGAGVARRTSEKLVSIFIKFNL